MSNHDANSETKAVDLTDYIQAMKETSFTRNWDIVVTYGHKLINNLLMERFQTGNHKLLTNIELSVEMDCFREKCTQWYQLSLGSPYVHFESTPDFPTCSLTVVITTAKLWTVSGDGSIKEDLDLEPNAYTISVRNISLGAATGTVRELDNWDANTLGISCGKEMVVFPDERGYSSYIVFDFTASSMLTVSLDHSPDVIPPRALKQGQFLTALQESLIKEIKEMPYILAVVNNAMASESTSDLVPRSFRFTTISAQDDEDSYLSVFIRARSSERNDDTPLQSLWISEWVKAGVMPIPKGCSSSIIIKDSFFAESVIIPSLTIHNAICTLVEKAPSGDNVICVKATWPKLRRPEASWESHVRLIALEETKNFWIHSVEYDPNIGGKQLQIVLAQSNGLDKPPTISLEWSYSFDNHWNGTISRTERDPPVVGILVRNVLELNGTFKASYSMSLKKDLVDLNGDSFKLEVKKSDWTVEASKARSTDIRGIHLPIPGELVDQKKLLELSKDAAIDTIDFEFNLANLALFAETNVLPAGKAIKANLRSNLRIPRDVVVIGDLIIA